MELIHINQIGVLFGGLMVLLGIHYIISKDVLRKIAKKGGWWKINLSRFLLNWPDKAFNLFGATAVISGILVILNSELLLYAIPILLIVFFYQRFYYNKKAKKIEKKQKKKK